MWNLLNLDWIISYQKDKVCVSIHFIIFWKIHDNYPDLPTPKRQNWKYVRLLNLRAGKSSEKWVKSHEMSQISYRRDFQWGLWVIGSHTSLQSCSSKHHNQFYNFGFVISMFCWWPSWNKRNSKSAHLVVAASCGRLKECTQMHLLSDFFGLSWLCIDI